MRAINLLAPEVSLTSATDVASALLVRCVTTLSTGTIVTRKTVGGATIGSCTVIPTEPTYIFKDPSDTLTSAGACSGASITFMY